VGRSLGLPSGLPARGYPGASGNSTSRPARTAEHRPALDVELGSSRPRRKADRQCHDHAASPEPAVPLRARWPCRADRGGDQDRPRGPSRPDGPLARGNEHGGRHGPRLRQPAVRLRPSGRGLGHQDRHPPAGRATEGPPLRPPGMDPSSFAHRHDLEPQVESTSGHRARPPDDGRPGTVRSPRDRRGNVLHPERIGHHLPMVHPLSKGAEGRGGTDQRDRPAGGEGGFHERSGAGTRDGEAGRRRAGRGGIPARRVLCEHLFSSRRGSREWCSQSTLRAEAFLPVRQTSPPFGRGPVSAPPEQ
jgi:hypothetical protein